MQPEDQFLDNIAEIENRLAARIGMESADICGAYCSIRKPLKAILPIVALIPVYGKTIVKVIDILIDIAEQNCVCIDN
jgi:hypothetical protein